MQIRSQNDQVPFGIGIASDAMAVRRGGKKLPMEDVCYYHWPLPGMDKVLQLEDLFYFSGQNIITKRFVYLTL